ncbi:MAG: formylglycine-generating enzyme family protein [Bacteroidia bacterium]
MKTFLIVFIVFAIALFCSCNRLNDKSDSLSDIDSTALNDSLTCCESNIPSRFGNLKKTQVDSTANPSNTPDNNYAGMVWIDGGTFMMGADNKQASPDEYPKHKVTVDGFWMDITEVTNSQFAVFVKEKRILYL